MNSVKSWAESIIIVVIISIIVEMILPEGNNKKYVKIISGLYILYVIINPILSINRNFDVNEIADSIIGEETTASSSDANVANVYISGVQTSLENKIEELGYSVEKLEFVLSSDYSDILQVNIKMKTARI